MSYSIIYLYFSSQIQYLVEEIALHQRLKNKNIVSYLGCEREGVTVRIFMEQVPGGMYEFNELDYSFRISIFLLFLLVHIDG